MPVSSIDDVIEHVAVIEARWKDTTPGPWFCYNGWGPIQGTPFFAVKRIGTETRNVIQADPPREPIADRDLYIRHADAEAIVTAPGDIAWLCEQVRKLMEQNPA